jgi:hypothetical protein
MKWHNTTPGPSMSTRRILPACGHGSKNAQLSCERKCMLTAAGGRIIDFSTAQSELWERYQCHHLKSLRALDCPYRAWHGGWNERGTDYPLRECPRAE